jgi:outer membrane protein OmpA-like peptidoglycan-associated protein
MRAELNFEAESFGGYNPSEGEDPEQFMKSSAHEGWRGGGGGRWGRGGGTHGGTRFGRSHWPHRWGYRRWPWLQTGFGFGDFQQDGQSIAWAQGCLSQITGNMIPQSGRMDSATRSAIGMFQAQQQLPMTGTLDDATISALEAACPQAGEQENKTPVSAPKPSTLVLWFELNSTKLRQDSEADSAIHLALVIKESLQHLKTKGKPAKIILHGYASREGAEARNMQLAGQRADHVKEMLVTAGVPDDRIQVVNHGPNSDWPGLKWNRRVEVEFQPQP